MNTITAPSPTHHTPAHPFTQLDPATTSTEDTRTALAATHEVSQCLEGWQSVVDAKRDQHILSLWQKGQSQAEIADLLGVSKRAVRTILASHYAQASPAERESYARRATEEFEAEVFAEEGNLFSMQEPSAV